MNAKIFFRPGLVFLLGLISVFSLPVQAQENLDSLIANDLPFFQELAKTESEAGYKLATDTLLAKIVPSVDMETIEDRASCLELDMPLTINKTVCGFIHFFTVRKRNYTQTMLERKNYYFPIFEYYLRKHNMPDALKYLAIVESGLNFKAKSRTGAVGLWQFMPGTGKDFYLAQNHHLDERQNPYLATEAACKFLKYLYGMFNDWELALAAYNCGPGNVMKAMRKSGRRGFWEIYNFLPQETRSYVPQFHAVVYAMNFANEHLIYPDVDSMLVTVPLDTFRIQKSFDLVRLESMLGLPKQTLHQHNPTIRTHVFPSDSKHPLLVPASHSYLLAGNLEKWIDSARVKESTERIASISGLRFRSVSVSKGQKISEVAARYQVDPQLLCQVNRLKGSRFAKSRRIQIPVSAEETAPATAAVRPESKPEEPAIGKQLEDGRHQVAKGEKLYQVAVRYGCTTSQLRKWNKLPSSKINEGQILLVQLPEKEAVVDGETSPESASPVAETPSHAEDCLPDPVLHQVKKGDRLYALAKEYKCSMEQVLALNPGLDPKIREGQVIRFPSVTEESRAQSEKEENGEAPKGKTAGKKGHTFPVAAAAPKTYKVQKGDTLYSISKKFNHLSIRDLMRLNKLKDRHIRPGQKLVLG